MFKIEIARNEPTSLVTKYHPLFGNLTGESKDVYAMLEDDNRTDFLVEFGYLVPTIGELLSGLSDAALSWETNRRLKEFTEGASSRLSACCATAAKKDRAVASRLAADALARFSWANPQYEEGAGLIHAVFGVNVCSVSAGIAADTGGNTEFFATSHVSDILEALLELYATASVTVKPSESPTLTVISYHARATPGNPVAVEPYSWDYREVEYHLNNILLELKEHYLRSKGIFFDSPYSY